MTQFTHPIADIVHSTVKIECVLEDGQQSSGTGYIYIFCQSGSSAVHCIVTNKHVVQGARQGIFYLTIKKSDGSADLGNYEPIIVSNLPDQLIPHPSQDVDLVALPIGKFINDAMKNGKHYYFVPVGRSDLANDELLNDITAMEEIVMVGYPDGLWDQFNNLPIIRRGTTATHAKLRLNGKPEFMIDAACFPGSSGSPVFLVNVGGYLDRNGIQHFGKTRVALLGTLYAGPQFQTTGEIEVVDVPTVATPITRYKYMMNLGYVIHASELLILEQAVYKKVYRTLSPLRNSECSCGSGKKFKSCCGLLA